MRKPKYLIGVILSAFSLLTGSWAAGQEVFIGNPGKSLNFFHFGLAIEKGFSRSLAWT